MRPLRRSSIFHRLTRPIPDTPNAKLYTIVALINYYITENIQLKKYILINSLIIDFIAIQVGKNQYNNEDKITLRRHRPASGASLPSLQVSASSASSHLDPPPA